MSAEYPGAIKTFREIEDLPGVVYEPDQKTTIFAKDTTDISDEVVAIEQTLGTNPNGEYETVADRLDDMGGGGTSFIYEKVILSEPTNIFSFSTEISMDTMRYLRFRCIFPGILNNNSLRLVINNDLTAANYPRVIFAAYAFTTNTATVDSSNLSGLTSNITADNATLFWDFELRKTVGKYLSIEGECNAEPSNWPAIRKLSMHYKGTASDISDISFRRDSGNFPVGTTFILSEV